MTIEEKAKKWDALATEIAGNYVNPENGELWTDEECEDKGFDLISIGLQAAQAYGWL